MKLASIRLHSYLTWLVERGRRNTSTRSGRASGVVILNSDERSPKTLKPEPRTVIAHEGPQRSASPPGRRVIVSMDKQAPIFSLDTIPSLVAVSTNSRLQSFTLVDDERFGDVFVSECVRTSTSLWRIKDAGVRRRHQHNLIFTCGRLRVSMRALAVMITVVKSTHLL